MLSDPPRAERFLALTGLTPDDLRAGLGDASVLGAVLDFLADEFDAIEVGRIYAATDASLPDLKTLEKQGLIALADAEVWRDPLAAADDWKGRADKRSLLSEAPGSGD